MSYYEWIDGYAIESTRGTSVITGAGDTTYLIGNLHERAEHPSPVYSLNQPAVGVNAKEVTAGTSWKGQATYRGMWPIELQNGIPLWLVMGLSSTAGAGPYTHTITPTTDGSGLPSITFQHEERGGGTDEEYQYQGVLFDSLMLHQDWTQDYPCLRAKVNVRAMSYSDPGFALTNAPSLPATSNTDPYVQLTRTWDSGGTPVSIAAIEKFEFSIQNGLSPLHAHRYDTGTYVGRDPYGYVERTKKMYECRLTIQKHTIERKLHDELVSGTNTKEAVFKWTRSTNDYIQLSLTNCQVLAHPVTTPKQGDVELIQVNMVPEQLSIEVKDSIAGGAYGE